LFLTPGPVVIIWHPFHWNTFLSGVFPGLPDGIFSNQKSQFG
jgi:hypothetical protein